ncbi:acyl-CoA thioesterase [Auritidibacter ignavus]|uniref:acyl-CoA thioesterase n=1 Tax=Auritidibacter ignavus TaxID=678932 RepID=UPI0024BA83B4|nr:thioesterase family protein [Auritidibacter ignavus]WHS27276.1 thioesterase family protein [Auritidibacter ignavus]
MSPVSTNSSHGVNTTVQIHLRWGDMDAYGHVNNVQIVRLMEEARVLAFGTPSGTGAPESEDQPEVAAPIDLISSVPEGVLTLISEHTVRYRRQLPYRRQPVPVRLQITKVKAAAIEVGYEFIDPVTAEVAVTASSTLVFVDAESGRPVRLNDEQKARLHG